MGVKNNWLNIEEDVLEQSDLRFRVARIKGSLPNLSFYFFAITDLPLILEMVTAINNDDVPSLEAIELFEKIINDRDEMANELNFGLSED